jgi:hypothetical protein
MKPYRSIPSVLLGAMLAPASLLLAPSTVWAQQTSAAAGTASPAAAASAPASTAAIASDDEVIELSPFEVTAEDDRGYLANRTMSGTRLNTRIEDIAASISVVTREQLIDTAAVDINDIFLYEGNTEGTMQYTSLEFVPSTGATGDTVIDRTANSPATSNRIRGLGAANLSIGGFESTSGLAIDTYNVDAVEISRGPNSNIFGLGGAAGTVNVITGSANLSRQSMRAAVRFDSYGGSRYEGSLNAPVANNNAAFRVAFVHEDKGFTREPAYEKTNRVTLALTVRPWHKTTLRATHEVHRNSASRPNSITPRDFVTPWINAGSPTWNPITATLTKADGTVVASGVRFNDRATRLFLPGNGVNVYNDAFATRINQFIDQGELTVFTPGRRPADVAATSTAIPGPLSTGADYYYFITTGEKFPTQYESLWRTKGVTDQSLYDWEEVNFYAPNFSELDSWNARLSLEQEILRTERQYLALQLAGFQEKSDEWMCNFIGESGGIPANLFVDINQYMLDGTANPYFRRPFMAGSEPQKRRKLNDAKTGRLNVVYSYDFTRNDGWMRWLGRHTLTGYGEVRRRTYGTLGYRDYILRSDTLPWFPETTATGTYNAKVSNSYRQTVRYYMGDANGQNIDYAPSRLASAAGYQDLYWYDGRARRWLTQPVELAQLYDANRLTKEKRYTMGGVWQGEFLNGRLIPTVGYRDDRRVGWEGQSRIWDAYGYPDITPVWNFSDPDFAYDKDYNGGITRQAGVVAKPLSWLYLHYNQSDSFKPESKGFAIDQTPLLNPRGTGKDYGFTLFLGRERQFMLRYNQYETVEEHARTSGSAGTWATRLVRMFMEDARNTEPLGGDDDWNVECQAYIWVLASHRITPGAAMTALTREQKEAYRQEAWERYLEPAGFSYDYWTWYMTGQEKEFGDDDTARARGREIEIAFNPSRYLTVKASLVQKKAFNGQVSAYNTNWLAENLDALKGVVVPSDFAIYNSTSGTWTAAANAGQSWWSTLGWTEGYARRTGDTAQVWYEKNVESQIALAAATAGQSKPQVREWTANASVRYSLAGLQTESFLKDIDVGGSLRWVDKGAIGYLYLDQLSGSGRYVYYDANSPVYDDGWAEVDFWARYKFRLSDKVRGSVQLNIRNAFESGGLRAVSVNPDGEARDFRIVDPRMASLSTTFEL